MTLKVQGGRGGGSSFPLTIQTARHASLASSAARFEPATPELQRWAVPSGRWPELRPVFGGTAVSSWRGIYSRHPAVEIWKWKRR
jgi:hypothetical protein